MSSRPPPDGLLSWALAALGRAQSDGSLVQIAGDASHRQYYRLQLEGTSRVVAYAPPQSEKNAEFVHIRAVLAGAGVPVPQIYDTDLERGFLLLEDLGDEVLLNVLDSTSVEHYYPQAFALLNCMAEVDIKTLPGAAYDLALLSEELGRFREWFVEGLLGYSASNAELELIDKFGELLINSALQQPQVLVHRDFHSRNLMLVSDGKLAVIDFQDAVIGPVTYDLASLLKDCYISWPRDKVCSWALDYRNQSKPAELLQGVDDETFLRWFDWMALQRHIKVLGTFARLYLRDGKAAYLEDLPLVIQYVRDALALYSEQEPVIAEFERWFIGNLQPLISEQSWSAET